jgi:hypothetical protein
MGPWRRKERDAKCYMIAGDECDLIIRNFEAGGWDVAKQLEEG